MMEIVPKRGVGALLFGQTPDEVSRILGTPSRVVSDGHPPCTVRQHFDKIICYYDDRQRLNLITLQRSDQELRLLGKDVFLIDVSALLGAAQIPTKRDEDSFGVVTIHAPSLGLDFCYEGGELLAIHVSKNGK